MGSLCLAAAAVVLASCTTHPRKPDSLLVVGTSPPLNPGFSESAPDYAVRCARGGLRLRARAQKGATISLDGHRVHGTTLDRFVRRRAGEAVTVRGARGNRAVAYHIRCVPPDFPTSRAHTDGKTQAGWYLMNPDISGSRWSYIVLFDRHGAPVWWMRTKGEAFDAAFLPGRRVAWSHHLEHEIIRVRSAPFEIHRLDGSRSGTVTGKGVATDYHELRPLANGHFLVLGTRLRDGVDLRPYGGPASATVIDGVVQELTPAGSVAWSWSSAGHIDPTEAGRRYRHDVLGKGAVTLPDGRKAYDLVHLNSAEPYGSGVLISTRQTDAVYYVDRSSGRIVWKLGGTHTAQSLRVTGAKADAPLFGGQHDARVLADGTITVHDNSTYLKGRLPRALRLAVDGRRRTARVIDEVTAPDVSGAYACGSARLLPGGNWVVSWGISGHAAEVDPNGREVLTIDLGEGVFSYRTIPILPGQLSAAALRAGMDAMAARRYRTRG